MSIAYCAYPMLSNKSCIECSKNVDGVKKWDSSPPPYLGGFTHFVVKSLLNRLIWVIWGGRPNYGGLFMGHWATLHWCTPMEMVLFQLPGESCKTTQCHLCQQIFAGLTVSVVCVTITINHALFIYSPKPEDHQLLLCEYAFSGKWRLCFIHTYCETKHYQMINSLQQASGFQSENQCPTWEPLVKRKDTTNSKSAENGMKHEGDFSCAILREKKVTFVIHSFSADLEFVVLKMLSIPEGLWKFEDYHVAVSWQVSRNERKNYSPISYSRTLERTYKVCCSVTNVPQLSIH